jgi:hypothetical protein
MAKELSAAKLCSHLRYETIMPKKMRALRHGAGGSYLVSGHDRRNPSLRISIEAGPRGKRGQLVDPVRGLSAWWVSVATGSRRGGFLIHVRAGRAAPQLPGRRSRVSRDDSATAHRASCSSYKAGEASAQRDIARLCGGTTGRRRRRSKWSSCSRPGRVLERPLAWTTA